MTNTLFTATPTPEPLIWSSEQNTIYFEFEHGSGNAVVVARAGVGKTTTAIEGVQRAPERRILMCAYNKSTEVALNKKLSACKLCGCAQGADEHNEYGHRFQPRNPNATSKTAHALGFSIVRKFRNGLKVDNTNRADNLTERVCGKSAPDAVKRLVTKLHSQGRENAPHATKVGDLTVLQIKFQCEPDEQWTGCQSCGRDRATHVVSGGGAILTGDDTHSYHGFDAQYVEQKALEAMELASNVQSGGSIDYADMIFLPVRNGWMAKQYDLAVIDEAQDMTVTQLEILQGVCGGRIIVIGDDKQAIYDFRGADSESLSRLKSELHAKELKLTTTYRCGKAIVREAQRLVPDFQAGPNNPEGEVRYLSMELLTADAGPGNFILSRVNAPLVSVAMKLLRAGKRTRIAGRDIGAGLKALLRKFNARSVPELLSKIGAWEAREIKRIEAQMATATNGRKRSLQEKIDGIIDQAGMLSALTDGHKNVADVVTQIDKLFEASEDEGMITCSSVHKAKGLEADKVYVLADTLRSNTQEELNIQYVAITRAKNTLVYVTKPQAE